MFYYSYREYKNPNVAELKMPRVLHEPRVAWRMVTAGKNHDPRRNHKKFITISSDSQCEPQTNETMNR